MQNIRRQFSCKWADRKNGSSLLSDWLTLNTKTCRFFYALTILYGIYVLPVLLADRFYHDDLTRSLRGVTGWNNDARPLAEWLMKWLCGGFPIGDISPLPLLLSVVLLSYVMTLYVKQSLPGRLAHWKVFCFSGVMCMIMLMTYQPCSGVYICLCMLELLFMILSCSLDLPRLIVSLWAVTSPPLMLFYRIIKVLPSLSAIIQPGYPLCRLLCSLPAV